MSKNKLITDGKETITAAHINAYLLDAPDIFLEVRSKPLCHVPPMILGSIPRDGGNFILTADEYDEFIRREPRAQKFIRQFMGGDEFLNGKVRYCLWLVDVTVEEIKSMPLVAERVEAVRQFRLSSKRAATRKQANTPSLFSEIRQPTTNYITVPLVSSERRKYIPMGFMSPDIIVSNLVEIIPDAGLYEFGILMSSVHMVWTGTVCGRLESRYRYSATIVYNNFPWLLPTKAQYEEITRTAQGILDARVLYPDWTLAALYDPNKMPPELRAAHEANDRLVMMQYEFDEKMSELEIITELLLMYEELATLRAKP